MKTKISLSTDSLLRFVCFIFANTNTSNITSISVINVISLSISSLDSRFKHSCPKCAMSSKMQSSSKIAQARRTVQQLRREACIEKIKVSKASSDLMRYCGGHAKNDPLLMGIPASENPFKDKKPCTVL
uniref:Guanine nucleotide-binding protein subunit gamma n=1 Tax=Mola mola TaxID=94237 RepID=A0A3Q3WVF0_MOLML